MERSNNTALSGRPRVLLVDDNAHALDSLAEILDAWGFEVRVAREGTSALQTAAEFMPRFVLLDISLPGMDGISVARLIRETEWGTGVKVLAMTGYPPESVSPEGDSTVFDGHLGKPLDFDHLREILNSERGPQLAR